MKNLIIFISDTIFTRGYELIIEFHLPSMQDMEFGYRCFVFVHPKVLGDRLVHIDNIWSHILHVVVVSLSPCNYCFARILFWIVAKFIYFFLPFNRTYSAHKMKRKTVLCSKKHLSANIAMYLLVVNLSYTIILPNEYSFFSRL